MEEIKKEELVLKLQNGDDAYNYGVFDNLDEERAKESAQKIIDYQNKYPYSKLTQEIPHITLNIPKFDHAKAKQEVDEAIGSAFIPINMSTTNETIKKGPNYHRHWASRALINYTPHSHLWFNKQSKECATRDMPEYQTYASSIIDNVPRLNLEDMKYYKTDLYNRLPYITKFIFDHICDTSYRAFIWKMGHDGYLNWHNHARLPWHSDVIANDKAIVHIPIVTDPGIRMLVRTDDKKIYSEHYAPGNAYVFNNVKDHAVENNTMVDRLHVAIFVPYHDKKFINLLDRSV
jgi:hypothetical protein